MRRKTAEELELAGTARPDRARPSVPGTVSNLPAPRWLDARGRRFWRTIAAALADRGVLSPAFLEGLEQASFWYSRFHRLREHMEAAADPCDKSRSVRVEAAATQLRASTQRLGLSPVDASKLPAVAAPAAEPDPCDEFRRPRNAPPLRAV